MLVLFETPAGYALFKLLDKVHNRHTSTLPSPSRVTADVSRILVPCVSQPHLQLARLQGKLKETDTLSEHFETPEAAAKIVKLKAFQKFEDTASVTPHSEAPSLFPSVAIE